MRPKQLTLAACLLTSGILVLHTAALQAQGKGQPPAAPPGPPDRYGDLLPSAAALQRFGSVRFHHGSKILCLAYSPNGKILAAGGGDDPVRLWDADSGKQVELRVAGVPHRINEPWIHAIAFSPNGQLIATGGGFKVIRLWDANTGKELRALKGHTATIKSLAFSPDGSQFVSGSGDRTVRRWDVNTGNQLALYEAHKDEVNAVAFTRDGKHILSGSGDRTVRLLNGKPGVQFNAGCAVMALAVSPDGKTFASAGDDNIVRLWNLGDNKEPRQLKGHKDTVVSLAFSPDGKALYSGALDARLHLWDVERGTAKLRAVEPGDCDALALSPDGKVLAVAGTNNTIRRFETNGGKEILTADAPLAGVTSIACSPDGKLIASAGTDTVIRLWGADGKEIKRWGGHGQAEVLLSFAADGKTLAAGAGLDGVRIWDLDGKQRQHLTTKEPNSVLCLAYAPKGGRLAAGYRNGGVRIWDTAEGKVVKQLPYPGGVHALAWSADGKWLAGAGSQKIALWDAASGQQLREIGKSAPVASLAFSPDGRKLAAGMYDSTIQLYDLIDAKHDLPIEGHNSAVYALAFSPNGRVIASGSYDKTVRLWETVNGGQINAWAGHLGPVSAVAILPRERKVVSGSTDGTLLVWEATGMLKDGKLPATDLPLATLESLWNDLASNDNKLGNRAMWTLVAGGKESAPYLTKKVFLIDPPKLAQYIRDLNDNKFSVRERASTALGGYGIWVEDTLKKAIEVPPSDEVRRRVERLLLALKGKSLNQERLRARRVIEVLEQAPTPEARALLTSMASRAPEEDLRETAAGALARLGQRGHGK